MTVNTYLLEHDDQEIRDSHKYQRLIEIIRIFVHFPFLIEYIVTINFFIHFRMQIEIYCTMPFILEGLIHAL